MSNRILNRLKDSARGMAGLFSRLIPSRYQQDPAVKRSLYKWLLIGLLIRLIFMPITVYQPDLLGVYWRSSVIAYDGIHWMGGAQVVIHYFHALFLLIFKPLMPYFNSILNDPKMGYDSTWRMFEVFIGHTNTFRTLFIFKVPYFLFDMGCAFLLLALFQDRKRGLFAFKFWIVNPIVIFATYMAARYETIPVFFILLSLYYAKKNLSMRSLFFLGISIVIRLYPLILLPLFVVILGRNLSQRLKLTFLGLLPLAIVDILSRLLNRPGEIGGLAGSPHASYLLTMSFSLLQGTDKIKIFVFIVAYTFLFCYTLSKTDHSFENLWKTNLIVLLLFFATCFFHVHYLMWLIPLLALQTAENRKFMWLFVVQVISFVVYTFRWEKHFAGWLFSPIYPSYFISLASPLSIIGRYYSPTNFLGIFRSIFSAVSLWMIYLVFKELSEKGRERV